MVSYYLTQDAAEKRLYALKNRLCGEAINLHELGGLTWMPESDFWLLPASLQAEVVTWTINATMRKLEHAPANNPG